MKNNRNTAFVLLVSLAIVLAGCSKTPTSSDSSSSTSSPSTPTDTVHTAVEKITGADPLPSWNDDPAKQSIMQFVKITTDKTHPQFVAPEDRIATFDQDGTLWVEHPVYSQLQFVLDRVRTLAPQHPEWSSKPLFKGMLIGNAEAMEKASQADLDELGKATQIQMPVDEFHALAKDWMATGKDKRYDKPYAQLVYQPMVEVLQYLRDNGYRTYIVTGGGQEFVRTYSQQVYGVPKDQVIGSAAETEYSYDQNGKAILWAEGKTALG